MNNTKAILVCFNYVNSQWELPIGQTNGVQRCLVAWKINPLPTDSGIPDEVAKILASTLASQALITFPTHKSLRGISFVHTNNFEDVREAFGADYFVWSCRGQVIFLSPKESSPPVLFRKHLELATDSKSLFKLTDRGVTGIVLPGVDGDVAGIYTFNDKLRDALLAELKARCEQSDVPFHEVSELELIEALASR